MAIFSRRTLQRLVNENSTFLSRKQTQEHVNRLNAKDLSVEWEIVLLNVFSKLGTVIHERAFGKKKPDLYFLSRDRSFSFLADIKTISDAGIELKNPFEQLNDRLHKEVLRHDIKGAWRIEIQGNHDEARREGRMVQMKLPALARFDQEIFNEKFEEFARLVKENPAVPHTYSVRNSSTDLNITYSPSDRWVGSGSYPGYKSIERREHLIQNSLYAGLEDKAYQLKESGFDGVLGIMVCDGGSDFLRRGKNIIEEFLYTHPHIQFIMAFWVEQTFGWRGGKQVFVDAIINAALDPKLEDLIKNFHSYADFPFPQRDARNAVNLLRVNDPEKLGSFFGGCTVSHSQIRLSSRTVLDLLAGKLSYEDFPEIYRDFFAGQVNSGRMFKSVEIEISETEEDDDWLLITFGEPDPAVTSFRVPNNEDLSGRCQGQVEDA